MSGKSGSTLKKGLNARELSAAAAPVPSKRNGTPPATVLIGGHFPSEVRRVLLLVQAEPKNRGKNLKSLLGEAINDLCAKYGKPQPYTWED